MRVLWISCLLLGIVTTLPTRRGTVTPRTSDPNLKYRERGFIFNPRPFGIDGPAATGAATPVPAREGSFYFNPKPFGIYDPAATGAATLPLPAPGYAGYPMGHAAGYEGAPPPPASGVPYAVLADANPGYDPWGTPLPGYEGVPAHGLSYAGYPTERAAGYGGAPPPPASGVPYAGLADANPGYDPWGTPLPGYERVPAHGLSYAGYPMEHAAGYEGAPPVAQYEGHPVPSDYYDGPAAAPPPHVPEMGSPFPGSPYPGAPYYQSPYPDSPYPVSPYYEAPVATTQPDGQEAPPVAPDHGHYWGSVGGDANEPVFSDVKDLAPVSSSNSRSRYMRGRTVFYEATYVPEEGPAAVPAETSSAPEEALGPATRPTPWMGYSTGPLLQKRPAETSYAPVEALGGPATRPTPWMGYSTGPLLQKRPAETSYAPEEALGPATRGFERPFTDSGALYPSP